MHSSGRHGIGRLVGRVALALAVLLGVMVGLGLLVTKVLQDVPPLTAEDEVNRSLAAGRTPDVTAVSGFLSQVGSTPVIIGVMLVVAVVFRLVFHRWRESVFLVLAVSAQALVFLFTTLLVSRNRPEVPHLDDSPPTSSFPSGHTGAATALYLGIAVVIAWHTRHAWARRSVVLALLLVPLSVGLARLYRGMHHPSDVLAAIANGIVCVYVSARSLLVRALPRGLAARLDPAEGRKPPAAVVRGPR